MQSRDHLELPRVHGGEISWIPTLSIGHFTGCENGRSPASHLFFVTGPGPPRNLSQWMKLVVGFRMGVLHRGLEPNSIVGSDGRTELVVGGKVRCVERSHVELDEPLPLLLGDPKVSVDVDEMCEAELSGEAVGAAEGLGGEGGEVVDVFRLACPEERPEEGILEDAAVEGVLEAVQRRLAANEFVERRRRSVPDRHRPSEPMSVSLVRALSLPPPPGRKGLSIQWRVL